MNTQKKSNLYKYLNKKPLKTSFASFLWIVNSQFWKSITSPIFAFIFPLIFILILGNVLGYYSMFGSFMAISSTAVGVISLAMAIFEFKSSILAKRIGATKITKKVFLISIILYYSIMMVVGTLFTFGMSVLIFSPNFINGKVAVENITNQAGTFIPNLRISNLKTAVSVRDYVKYINWGGFIYGLFLNVLVSCSLGVLIAAFAKSALVIQGISVPILVISLFLAAQTFPISMVGESKIFWYASYITPFKASSNIIIPSFNGTMDPNWTENNVISIKNLADYIHGDEFKLILEHKGLTTDQVSNLVKTLSDSSQFRLSGSVETLKIANWSAWLKDLNEAIASQVTNFVIENNSKAAAQAASGAAIMAQPSLANLPDSYQVVGFQVNNIINLSGSYNPFSTTPYKVIDRAFNGELIEIMTGTEKIINLFIPYAWIILLAGIALKGFKWTIR